MMAERLTGPARDAALAPLIAAGWALVEGRDAITKTFKFKDFSAAFGWMASLATVAEKMNHHPEWSNVYSRVQVTLATHDVDGLSMLDMELARQMEDRAA